MGRRSRPRRGERRAAANAHDAARAAADRRRARRTLVGCAIAWVVGVAASAAAVVATGADELLWGLASRRTGQDPATFAVGPVGALVLAALLLAVPVLLAVAGDVAARERPADAARPSTARRTALTGAAAVAAVALVPNVAGCLWVSGARPGSSLLVVPMVWPWVAIVFGPVLWAARDLLPWSRADDPPAAPTGAPRR